MPQPPNPICPVRIGSLLLGRNLLLAPMHEHTHLALRLLCRREGAALAYTEMATPEDLLAPPSEEEIRRHPEAARPGALSHKAGNILASAPEDRPLGVQLLPRRQASVLRQSRRPRSHDRRRICAVR